jgi:rhomboid protease GluP
MDGRLPPLPPAPPEERPLLITADMLVPVRPKDSRVPFEKGMSYFPLLVVLLLLANAAVFLWEIATGALLDSESVIAAGALHRDSVLAGQWWRLFTAAFLHGGFDHILGNAIFLYILGLGTEHAFGLVRTTAIYLFAALCGSLLSLAMSPGPAVGASGAIFGLMGALAVVFYRRRADFYVRDRAIGAFVGLLAVYQIFIGFTEPFVDNWAHLGGCLGGAAAVLVLRPVLGQESRLFSPAVKSLAAAAIAVPIALWLFAAGYLHAIEAQAWLLRGDKPAAIAAATRAIETNPANTYMLYLRGTIYLRSGQPDAGLADLDAYLRLSPRNARAFYIVGHVHHEREHFPKAIEYYSRALALDPGNVHYLNSRGYARILTGDYAAARADFDAILAKDPKYAPAWGNLGLIRAYRGDYPQAIELLEKARAMDSSQKVLGNLIAALRAERQGQRADAAGRYSAFIGAVKDERAGWLAEIRFAESRLRILRAAK